jgi:K+-sensing histidine kinase KdpD
MKTKLLCTLQSCLGIVVSALCAVAIAKLFARTDWKLAAPFLFAAVLVLLASRFGAAISVPGSLLAAMIFALLLFSPLHSLHVENESERASLYWMTLLSVSLSYLLYPSPAAATASESAPEPDAFRGPSQKFVATGKMAEIRFERQGQAEGVGQAVGPDLDAGPL